MRSQLVETFLGLLVCNVLSKTVENRLRARAQTLEVCMPPLPR